MKFIYSFKKRTFYPMDGKGMEIRISHSLLCGLIKWTTTKNYPNNLFV